MLYGLDKVFSLLWMWITLIDVVWSAAEASGGSDKVGFYLFPNKDNISDYDQLKFGDIKSIRKTRFMKRKKIIFLVHGYRNDLKSRMPVVVLRNFFKGNYPQENNIVAVDWSELAGKEDENSTNSGVKIPKFFKDIPVTYVTAKSNVEVVGKVISDFIQFLISKRRIIDGNFVHLIGHSLGAHVCGMAGMNFFKDTGEKIDRISGLDPAGPGFTATTEDKRLDKSDAGFVDVVHTNDGEYGYLGALGTVDFLLNGGGPFQPGCDASIALEGACSHWRAVYYFAISIIDSTIMAKPKKPLIALFSSETTIIFGYHCPRDAAGEYTLEISFNPE